MTLMTLSQRVSRSSWLSSTLAIMIKRRGQQLKLGVQLSTKATLAKPVVILIKPCQPVKHKLILEIKKRPQRLLKQQRMIAIKNLNTPQMKMRLKKLQMIWLYLNFCRMQAKSRLRISFRFYLSPRLNAKMRKMMLVRQLVCPFSKQPATRCETGSVA